MPAVPKPSYKRFKPTAKQRGAITPTTRRKLAERSQGVCEWCHNERAVHAAHLVRRWQIEGRTTVNHLAHLCLTCHIKADTTAEGRAWLKVFREQLGEKTKCQNTESTR